MYVLLVYDKHQKTGKTSDKKNQKKYIAENKKIDGFFEMDNMRDKLFEVRFYIDLFIINVKYDYKHARNQQTENLHTVIDLVQRKLYFILISDLKPV